MIIVSREWLYSRCNIDNITDNRRIHSFLGSNRSHDYTSCIDSYPDIDISSDSRDLEFPDKFLDLYSCMNCIISILFVEYCEYTITEILIDISMMAIDDISDTIKIDIEEEECSIWVTYRFTYGREFHNIKKHDSKILLLCRSENDTFVSTKSYFWVDFFWDKGIKYLFKIWIIFLKEFILDISSLKEGKKSCILIKFLIFWEFCWFILVSDKSRKIIEQLIILTPISRIDIRIEKKHRKIEKHNSLQEKSCTWSRSIFSHIYNQSEIEYYESSEKNSICRWDTWSHIEIGYQNSYTIAKKSTQFSKLILHLEQDERAVLLNVIVNVVEYRHQIVQSKIDSNERKSPELEYLTRNEFG